jgi:regulator of replication initiation timing
LQNLLRGWKNPLQQTETHRIMSHKDDTMNRKPLPSLSTRITALVILAGAATAWAQTQPDSPEQSARTTDAELERHLDQLTSQLGNMQKQLQDSQQEMDQLRVEVHRLRMQLAERSESEEAAQDEAALRASVEKLREDTDVLQAEVKQHDQTKVETVSKYPVRIGGTILFTSVLNSGTVDNIDDPVIALPNQPGAPQGSLSATARQTILGIDASGPRLWNAKSSADLTVDFFGGIPYAYYTTAAGLARLRTARAKLEWLNRSLSVAFDRAVFSPWQPTSWVTVGEPALAWAGNLWTWTPQLQFHETGILPNRKLTFDFGLMDPATPSPPNTNGLRTPNPAEQSKQPGYEARVGYDLSWRDQPIHLGGGGFYSRQVYSFGRDLDAWAGTADWNIALARSVALSGQFYRGRGIGGLGGGTFKDYVTFENYQYLRGLDAEGGWGQLKFVISPLLEANLAAGQDNAFANELRYSDVVAEQNMYENLARNQDVLTNLIFRPRSYMLFSAEFRQIRSWPIVGERNVDRIFGMAAGYSF